MPLKRTAQRIAGGLPLTIVAVGSSSTSGAGASSPANNYPSRLEVELREHFPRVPITVHNRGVGGETAREMLARFEGLDRLKAAGLDIVLMNPQYAPKVITKHDVDGMVDLIAHTAKEANVDLFQRFALMRYWRLTEDLPFSVFLSPDELHMNDWSYGCVAKLLGGAIADAATRATVTATAAAPRR
jgi:hypothetical protein